MSQGQSVDIGYSTSADRLTLTLRSEQGRVRLWLTRRLVKGFLIRFADMLERTVAAESSSARAAVSFEHLEACGAMDDGSASSPGDGRGAGESSGERGVSDAALVTEINVTARRRGFVFTLTDADEQTHNLGVSRAEAHRLASAIYRKAQAGGWDLEGHVGWLAESEAARGHAQPAPAASH